MTRHVIITIKSDNATAMNVTAARIINNMTAMATWINTNHPGLIDSLTATSRNVTVDTTQTGFTKDGSGNLI